MENQGEILNDHDDQDRSLVLTVRETAAELACSEARIRRLIASGDLSAIRLGDGPRSPYRVPRRALDLYLARRLDKQATEAGGTPQLKTNKRSGSSAAWASPPGTRPLVGGAHA